jgi:hypothetical protein
MRWRQASKRIKVAKYIHNWQNVGSQKLKHHQSSKNTEKEEEEITDKCPFGCGQSEIPQHYLRCQQNDQPSLTPSVSPSSVPSAKPSSSPSALPSALPSLKPSAHFLETLVCCTNCNDKYNQLILFAKMHDSM